MVRLGICSLEHPHSRGNHIPALKYMKDRFPIVAIYDEDPELAKEYCDLLGAKYYSSYEEMLKDEKVDAVLVTSVNDTHSEKSIMAAKAGKTVFCDKPIATSVEDAVAVAKAVKETGVPFFTTFPVRFSDAVIRTKKMIDEGRLGKIIAIEATNHGSMYEPGVPAWVLDPARNGGGCIIDHTVHVADIIRWFTGQEFKTVKAVAKHAIHDNVLPDVEDLAFMQGRMTGGAIFQIDASWSRRPEDPMWGDVTMRVVGEKGAAYLDLYNNQRMEVYVKGQLELQYPNLVAKEHGDIFDDYNDYVEKGITPIGANEIDGLRTVELAYAAYDSLRQGMEVDVKVNEI